MAKRPKPKKIAYEVITRADDQGIYARLSALISEHHRHLRNARIALAWCDAWKPNVDGRLTLGMCRRVSGVDRELLDFDFVILLNRTFWQRPEVTNDQRTALLDHELCHAAVALDTNLEDRVDVRDRTIYRMRGHDIEEFAEIVERYGCYRVDLERFAAKLAVGEQARLAFDESAATPRVRGTRRRAPVVGREAASGIQ